MLFVIRKSGEVWEEHEGKGLRDADNNDEDNAVEEFVQADVGKCGVFCKEENEYLGVKLVKEFKPEECSTICDNFMVCCLTFGKGDLSDKVEGEYDSDKGSKYEPDEDAEYFIGTVEYDGYNEQP